MLSNPDLFQLTDNTSEGFQETGQIDVVIHSIYSASDSNQ